MATVIVVIQSDDTDPDILLEDTKVLFQTERDFNHSTVSFAKVSFAHAITEQA